MTTLEKVARAAHNVAYNEDPIHPDWEWQGEGLEIARAVLMAVREPSRKWAADVCEDLCEPELVFNPAPASAFTAIVDAILDGK